MPRRARRGRTHFGIVQFDSDRTLADIDGYSRNSRSAAKISKMSACPEDCDVLANAIWIEEKTGRATSLVTDGRDPFGCRSCSVIILGR
jgi:hypothetical protein